MLFLALTRSSLKLAGNEVREFVISPGWFLTCLCDHFLSQIVVSDEEITISESIMAESHSASDAPFVVAHLSRTTRVLEIEKQSISGRPVYYTSGDKGAFFVSTHISLLRQAGVNIREDADTLPELLVYRLIAPPRTMYRGIRQIQFAGRVAAKLQNDEWMVTEEGYDPPQKKTDRNSESESIETLAQALKTSLLRLRPAASRVATLLSGGLDSSILGIIARDQLGVYDSYSTSHPLDNPWNPEQEYAVSAAAALSTRHSLFAPTPGDFLTGFVEGLAASESPLNHLQSVLLYLLFKHGVPSRFDRIVCGEAADCTFGQSTHFLLSLRSSLRARTGSIPPVFALLRNLGRCWEKARFFADTLEKADRLCLPISDPLNAVWSDGAYGDFGWVERHYGCSREQILSRRAAHFEKFQDRGLADLIAIYSLNTDVATTTGVWSKLAESQRKLMYYPFADQQVQNAGFDISWDMKLKSEKYIVREVARRLKVPGLILRRPKQSFGIASRYWAEKDGPLQPLIGVAAKAVDIKLLRSLQGMDPARAMTLWSLLNYAVLQRLFVNNEPAADLLDEIRDNPQTGLLTQERTDSTALATAS